MVGLIAHELAHLQLFIEKGITKEKVLEKRVDMREAEIKSNELVEEWGMRRS